MDKGTPTRRRPGFFRRLRRTSRRIFRKLYWKIRCSSQQTHASSVTSSVPSHILTGVSSPYHGVPYHRVSALMDVDYFRGSINLDGVTQSGLLERLRVTNPDRSTGSHSLGGHSGRPATIERQGYPPPIATIPPCLPDLFFVTRPEPTLTYVVAAGLQDVEDSTSPDGCRPFFTRYASPSHPDTESMSRGSSSQHSRDDWHLPSRSSPVSWDVIPRSLELVPTSPKSPRPGYQQPVYDYPCRDRDTLTSITGTSVRTGHRSSSLVSGFESLDDTVGRVRIQWLEDSQPPSSRRSNNRSVHPSARSSAVSRRTSQMSWGWGLFVNADSLSTIPLVLSAAKVAQSRRPRRTFPRRALFKEV